MIDAQSVDEVVPENEEAKPPFGRPTKYKPEMCERVLQFAREGMGRVETAAELGVAMSTFQQWEIEHPEFAQAMTDARDFSHAWWATQGRRGIWGGKSFNANAYALQVRNRFPADWKDKREVDMPGGINITITSDDAKL